MRAAVVTPGRAGSARVEELPDPRPGPGEVLVESVRIGLDGTDREMLLGYGEPPPGADSVVIGHEAVGIVRSASEDLASGDLVVPIVRRPDPDPCANCAIGEWDCA